MRTFLVAMLAIGGTLLGCVDQGSGPQPKRVDPGYVGKHLLQAPPPNLTRLDVDLGGKVIYLGNTVNIDRAIPGAAFKVTHYWRVVAPIGPGWQVFSTVLGEPTKPDFMNLPPTEMQRAHGPATWAAGEIIEDEQEIFLRPDWRSIDATVYVGLIEVGAHGIGDRMAASGPHVKDRAVIARRLEIDLSKAPPPVGTLHVPYAQGPIEIDGNPTDPGWMAIASSPEWPTAEGSPEPQGKAVGKLTWDDQNLYVYANVTDPEVFSEFKNQDDPLWKQDAIELFIDADGNRRGYVELQVNPNNVTFDSWFPGGRAAKGDEAWDSGMITGVKLNPGQGWEVEIAIPWAAVKGREDAMSVRLPPQVGDRWRMNVVRVDKKQDAKQATASSWNRISYSDWHGLERMLTVVFADQKGGVAPGTAPIPAPPVIDPGMGSGSAAGSAAPPAGSASGSAAAPAAGSASGSAAGRAVPPAGSASGSAAAPAAGSASGSAAGSAAPRAGSASGSAAAPVAPRAGSASGSPAAPVVAPRAGGASGSGGAPVVAPRAGSASGSTAGSAAPVVAPRAGSAAPAAGSASGSASLGIGPPGGRVVPKSAPNIPAPNGSPSTGSGSAAQHGSGSAPP